ncbi:MAG: energy transducer TonB [Thermoanaerobaculia bacterium]|nr:energy transducer TonB [Thermoanaerobaculia bacterium]
MRLPVFLLLLVTLAAPAHGQMPELGLAATIELSPTGDALQKFTLSFPAAVYTQGKTARPNAMVYLRDLGSARSDEELAPGATARYDDASSSVILEGTVLGAAKNLGQGRWEYLADEQQLEFVGTGSDVGRPATFFYLSDPGDGVHLRGKVTLRLPAKAREVQWDGERRVVRYRLPVPALTGRSQLELDLKAKSQLLSGVYKVYGLGQNGALDESLAAQWVAKAVLRNRGSHAARNLRLRFRLTPYSEWSVWQRFPEVLPGQTVVSTFYPVLDPKIASLRSNTPADVHVEWTYEEADGTTREDSDGKRVTLLGAHEFVFSSLVLGERLGDFADEVSNHPLLAAYVSRDDPAVTAFAALANKRAGGVAAGENDEQALAALQALYELLVVNDVTYQHPPSLIDGSSAIDYHTVQSLKYPRDVLRDRSGTCIDLAMLYAAAAHAIGLPAYLALVPGHAFPVIDLPSGNPAAVETTMVGGGRRAGANPSQPFTAALEAATQLLEAAGAQGQLVIVDFRDFWTKGVANPELEPLPPSILTEWGYVEGPPLVLGSTAASAAPIAVGGDVFPPIRLSGAAPEYTASARRARIQGTVEIRAVIDSSGRVIDAQVAKGLPMGLSEQALQAVRGWHFRPATRRGEPVTVYYDLGVHFGLE